VTLYLKRLEAAGLVRREIDPPICGATACCSLRPGAKPTRTARPAIGRIQ